MFCCKNIINLGCFDSCAEFVNTDLKATASGEWTFQISYMGVVKSEQKELENDEEIKIDTTNLNEDYTYMLRILLPNGELFNDTCYSFKTYRTTCN